MLYLFPGFLIYILRRLESNNLINFFSPLKPHRECKKRGSILKIAVGLSGGVDSAVTAALLKQEGHDVIGVSMAIWNGGNLPGGEGNACYGPDEKEDLEAAREISRIVGIPFEVFSIPGQYEDTVLKHFRTEYALGRTPNPCVICNARMKFGALPDQILKAGIHCDKIATGHYARIDQDETGRYFLKEDVDVKRDQTYFLHRLNSDDLKNILFPLGIYTKEEVRVMAKDFGLPVHDKKDSRGFYSGDYRDVLGFAPETGDIIDTEGNLLGKHSGVWNFTIGQRKGLDIDNKNLFVLNLNRKNNTVMAGDRKHLYRSRFSCADINWLLPAEKKQLSIDVKIGNTHPRAGALLNVLENNTAEILYRTPQVAIAPGQSAVFYTGDTVIGGGFIRDVLDETIPLLVSQNESIFSK